MGLPAAKRFSLFLVALVITASVGVFLWKTGLWQLVLLFLLPFLPLLLIVIAGAILVLLFRALCAVHRRLKPRLSAPVATAVCIGIVIALIVIADRALPPELIEESSRRIQGNKVSFVIPLTGGEVDSCRLLSPPPPELGKSILIKRSRLLKLCTVEPLTSKSIGVSDEALLIQSAIDFSYRGIYNNLSELQEDYPGFTPRIRRWSDDLIFLFGEGLYAVQLPEKEIMVTNAGLVKTTRRCGSVGAECTLVAPTSPRSQQHSPLESGSGGQK